MNPPVSDPSARPPLPAGAIDRLTRPVRRFLHVESASGLVLLACTVVALAFAFFVRRIVARRDAAEAQQETAGAAA
jgi:hypothetical protein